jgi:hypothetical protein
MSENRTSSVPLTVRLALVLVGVGLVLAVCEIVVLLDHELAKSTYVWDMVLVALMWLIPAAVTLVSLRFLVRGSEQARRLLVALLTVITVARLGMVGAGATGIEGAAATFEGELAYFIIGSLVLAAIALTSAILLSLPSARHHFGPLSSRSSIG